MWFNICGCILNHHVIGWRRFLQTGLVESFVRKTLLSMIGPISQLGKTSSLFSRSNHAFALPSTFIHWKLSAMLWWWHPKFLIATARCSTTYARLADRLNSTFSICNLKAMTITWIKCSLSTCWPRRLKGGSVRALINWYRELASVASMWYLH